MSRTYRRRDRDVARQHHINMRGERVRNRKAQRYEYEEDNSCFELLTPELTTW